MQTIGFIGLGIMGKPMARNLLKAGYPLIVGNRSQGAVQELVAEGARTDTTAQAIAAQSDVVITMLPDSPDVDLVVLGATGVLAGARAGSLLIDMSTISPVVARKLAAEAAKRNVTMLDAPVSGGEAGAISAALSIMVGGTGEGFERALPIFQALGKNIVHIGEAGAGQVAKAANQVIVALTIAAVGEALTLARNAGADPAKVRQALLGGFAQSRILDVHGQRVLDRNFKPGFRVRLHEKDLGIALATGKEYGSSLVLTAIVQQYLQSLKAAGKGDLDHSGLVTLIEEMSAKPV
jgi:2-hydroxy-3-oxopropionate reductase